MGGLLIISQKRYLSFYPAYPSPLRISSSQVLRSAVHPHLGHVSGPALAVICVTATFGTSAIGNIIMAWPPLLCMSTLLASAYIGLDIPFLFLQTHILGNTVLDLLAPEDHREESVRQFLSFLRSSINLSINFDTCSISVSQSSRFHTHRTHGSAAGLHLD